MLAVWLTDTSVVDLLYHLLRRHHVSHKQSFSCRDDSRQSFPEAQRERQRNKHRLQNGGGTVRNGTKKNPNRNILFHGCMYSSMCVHAHVHTPLALHACTVDDTSTRTETKNRTLCNTRSIIVPICCATLTQSGKPCTRTPL